MNFEPNSMTTMQFGSAPVDNGGTGQEKLRTRVGLMIPVLNPGQFADALVAALATQSVRPDEILVVDSSSDDGAVAKFEALGAKLVVIRREDYDHGGTRNMAFSLLDADTYVFMTQDAIPADDRAIEKLLLALERNDHVGAAYGRQLPRPNASAFASHARLFNYPAVAETRNIHDVPRLGIRAAFISNSFAAYRRAVIERVGRFQEGSIFGEDTALAARILRSGWHIAYAPEAMVVHSHEYSIRDEFARYFDVGVFHARDREFMRLLQGPTTEGLRFVRSEYGYLRRQQVAMPLARALLRNALRWSGYQLGRKHRYVPGPIVSRIGMNRSFWRGRARVAAAKHEREPATAGMTMTST